MFSNRLTIAALAAACIAAAGAGGYFASRQTVVQTPAASAAAASDVDAPNRPVQETEAVVEDRALPAQAPPEKVASGPTAAARRAETPRREAASQAPRPGTASRPQPLPTLDQTWPSNTSSQSSDASTTSAGIVSGTQQPAAADPSIPGVADDRATTQGAGAAEPPEKVLEEIVVAANSVIGLQTETRISSETARVEDRVEARVTRDVRVGEAIAIPAGARAVGTVTQVERGGKFKERARLGIRFTTLVLADGTRMSINTDTVYREGEAPGNSSAAKIGGGAVGGAILGAILGGAKGAAIGATAGAGGGAAAVQMGDRSEVTVPAGSPMTVRLLSPLTVTVEQQ
jgi:hypothetical protein